VLKQRAPLDDIGKIGASGLELGLRLCDIESRGDATLQTGAGHLQRPAIGVHGLL